MAEEGNSNIIITKPGVLTFGERLNDGSDITTFFQHETVVQVSCGEDHSAVVCESGRVCTFGKKMLENDAETNSGPRLVKTLNSVGVVVTQVACGYRFTVFLTNTGQLYSCGANDSGQLGLGHKEEVSIPTAVTGLPPIKKVAAGYDHTMILTVSGEVWGAGHNGYGQLGLGHTISETSFTQVPNFLEPIIDISSGGYHTALIMASRVLVMTGWNNFGQLGLGEVDRLCGFKSVSLPSTAIAAVSCGYYHTVALGTDGTTWAWGLNDSGQLGTGDYGNRSAPTNMVGLEDQTISQVNAGCHHTAVLSQGGDMFMCGDGTINGELGLGMRNLSTATIIPKLPGLAVQQVAFASIYSLMLVVPKVGDNVASQLQIGSTDLERIIMKSLECPVCFKIMSSPIHLCTNGHNLCGSCLSDTHIAFCPVCRGQFIAGRCIALENLSENVKLPCTDCLERMPVVELAKHGEVCPQRKYDCPVQQHSCDWSGQLDKMLAHTSSAHPDQTWRDLPHLFVHSLSDGLVHTDLLAAHDQVFTLLWRYDKKAKTFLTALRYIGPPENAHKFIFEFKFLKDHINNSYRRNVCSGIKSLADTVQSSNSLSFNNEVFESFIQQDRLVCQVAILKEVESSKLADQIKALLDE